MKTIAGAVVIALAVFPAIAANEPIPWAYAIPPAPPAGTPPAAPAPPDTSVKHLSGSTRSIHPRANLGPLCSRRLVSG